MDQFIGGIRPGEEAQVQQAKVVQRVQTSLERLAALGQAAHAVLPPNLHEVPARVLHLASFPRPHLGARAAACTCSRAS